MGLLRVITLTHLCVLLALAGCVAITVGVGLIWNPGGACIVGGGLAVASAIALFDPKPGSTA
jgi:hypothetical protein